MEFRGKKKKLNKTIRKGGWEHWSLSKNLFDLRRAFGSLIRDRPAPPAFLHVVVNGHGIVSWGAVDSSRPDGQTDQLIGFVTACLVPAKEAEVLDMLGYDSSKSDQTLVHIMTLGVVEEYRNFGIASSLLREVIKYASSTPTCLAIYLHVFSDNNPAISLYNKMSFKCVTRRQGFYLINGQHHDAYLFLYCINAGRSPWSPLQLLTAIVSYTRIGVNSMAASLCKSEDGKVSRREKCKESHTLVAGEGTPDTQQEEPGC